MQVCSYLRRAFREINISEHSVKWSSLNKSTWHNNTSGTWALFSPQHHLPLCVPELPNGVSPQASKSNWCTQIQWEFIGNWFCLAKTLLIRWTEMIIHFDPLSTEQFQTSLMETAYLTLRTHSTAFGTWYTHWPSAESAGSLQFVACTLGSCLGKPHFLSLRGFPSLSPLAQPPTTIYFFSLP